jgi:transcriptional regulator with XRE-family HTH domain
MKPATATIVREIRKFQKEHGLTMKAVSVGAGLSHPTVANWCRGHCGSTPRTRRMVRQYMREYSRNAPKARQIEWDDEFVSAYQSAHAFKVETPVHPGVFQRLVAPVRKLFSRGEAA